MNLYSSPLRTGVEAVLERVKDELVIVSPYIKASETDWLRDRFGSNRCASLKLNVITDLRTENVLNGSLDVSALDGLAKAFPQFLLTNLPRVHAKVYIADVSYALVTSANFTRPGLQSKFEYGVGIQNEPEVRKIRADMLAYAQIGNTIDRDTLNTLCRVSEGLSADFRKVGQSATKALRLELERRLGAANEEFLKAQVGSRSAHGLFADAILFILAKQPLSTKELHPIIADMFPDLCSDDELVINGQRFGKRWKHVVRTSQVFLRRSGRIALENSRWKLTSKPKP